jgi:hypothetical protein
MNTTFATPTHTIPTGGYAPWNSFPTNPTNWFGHPAQFNYGFAHPTFGYGYGPNGWWLGNQQFANGGGTNTWNTFGNPWLSSGWTNPGIWNAGIGTTPWIYGAWNTLPWNTAPFYGTNSPSYFSQSTPGWGNQPFFFNNTTPNWINPGINPSFIGNGFGTTYPTSHPSFNSFPQAFPTSTHQFVPVNTLINPGFNAFGQFAPTFGGYPTFNTGWGATPAWNASSGWTTTPGFTPTNTTPITNGNGPFGYTPGFQSPFANCVPAQAGCTGREAA